MHLNIFCDEKKTNVPIFLEQVLNEVKAINTVYIKNTWSVYRAQFSTKYFLFN